MERPVYLFKVFPIHNSRCMQRLSVCLLFLVACSADGQDTNKSIPSSTQKDLQQQESWLSRYDLGTKESKQFKLQNKLNEISGLAMTDDGRLFCHDDESAVVYQLDYRRGTVIKRFSLGSGFLEEDFEGIAVKKDTLYMVTSSGNILEFRESPDRGRSAFRLYKTPLSQKNDVEGLEYDPESDCLLLACKGDPGKGFDDHKAVYAFSLRTKKLLETPRFLLSLKDVKKRAVKGNFNPSGIARHPKSGTFFIVSADGESIVEIDRNGKLLAQEHLSKKVNSQAEGIAFAPDLSLLICNDGQGGTGTLTVYPMKQ